VNIPLKLHSFIYTLKLPIILVKNTAEKYFYVSREAVSISIDISKLTYHAAVLNNRHYQTK